MLARTVCTVILLALAPAIMEAQTATRPTLSYSTYLTGNDHTEVTASATDANGEQYVTGVTAAADFPTTANAYRRTPSRNSDPGDCEVEGTCEYQTMFVAKLNRGGTGLVYSTFIGNARPVSIAIDGAGNAYVIAQEFSTSTDMPTTSGAWRTRCASTFGTCDLLIKVNAEGSALVYSTFLEGSDCVESFNGVAVDSDSTGHAFVVGTGGPNCFMTAGAFKTTMKNFDNAVVMKFTADGSGVLYSTYVGQYNFNAYDFGEAIAVDSGGHAIITGNTSSSDFPTSGHAFQRVLKGSQDAFVAKLSADGSTLLASTLLGGSTDVQGNPATTWATSVAVDPLNYVYVAGRTLATDYPVAPDAPEPYSDPGVCGPSGAEDPCGDNFLTKLPLNFSDPSYSTFLGGPNGEEGNAYVTVDAVGHAFVDGASSSTEVPLVKPTGSSGDMWLAELNTAGTGFLFSTRYGNESTIPAGMGIDAAGNPYAGGRIGGSGLSTTPNAYQTVNTSADSFAGWAAKWDIPPCTLSSTDRIITICTASNGSTVAQRWLLAAGATDSVAVSAMKVYVDGKSAFSIQAAHFNTYIQLAPGPHHITVKAWDSSGAFAKSIDVTAK